MRASLAEVSLPNRRADFAARHQHSSAQPTEPREAQTVAGQHQICRRRRLPLCLPFVLASLGALAAAAAAAASEQLKGLQEASLGTQQRETEDESLMFGIVVANIVIFVIGFCDIYILNLAFADLMFLLGLVFLTTTMLIDHWIFGNLMCKLYMATTSLNQFASSLLLVIMSFDRFLAVCHPIYAQRFRRLRRAKIICLCIWITCLVLMTPIFAFAKTDKETRTCAIFWPEYESFNCEMAFTLYSFAIGFAFPLLLIAAFYTCVVRKLRKAVSGPANTSSSRRSRARETTNRRIEHLVIGIICTYTVCWLPYWIAQLCVSLDAIAKIPVFYQFFMVGTALSYTNSALNPILYAFLSDNFKRRCSDVFSSLLGLGLCCGTHSCIGRPAAASSNRNKASNTKTTNIAANVASRPASAAAAAATSEFAAKKQALRPLCSSSETTAIKTNNWGALEIDMQQHSSPCNPKQPEVRHTETTTTTVILNEKEQTNKNNNNSSKTTPDPQSI